MEPRSFALINASALSISCVLFRFARWIALHKNPYLSVARVGADDGLENFGVSPRHFQPLMRSFAWDCPMGCVLIDLQRRRASAIRCDGAITYNIALRSGMHFIRNYPSHSLGVVVYHGEGGRHEVAYIECARHCYLDDGARRLLRKLNERLLKVLVVAFDYVAFCRMEDPDAEE